MSRRFASCLVLLGLITNEAVAAEPSGFEVGAADRDITPPIGIPMWGYAARKDALSVGAKDRLKAVAVVIQAAGTKLAIVGMDLGRGPTPEMMARIRKSVKQSAGIDHVLIAGSHTHHGPVLELNARPGRGLGKYDAAIAYAESLPNRLIEAIVDADKSKVAARMAIGTEDVPLNRNRQAKHEPKPIDSGLTVVRFDDESNRPIAVLVNFAAHPTMTDSKSLEYSADYPGALRSKVEAELKTRCVFLQGASGDLSVKPPTGVSGPQAFGEALAVHVVEMARRLKPARPAEPSIAAKTESFRFKPRIDLANPLVVAAYSRAFFPELIACMADDSAKGVEAELNAVLLNGKIAIVATSGEFFCAHATRLRARSRFDSTLFVGYCNGHHMYFPTIEAAYEGGYGAEPGMSLAELGAGELMMDRALIHLYMLQGRFAAERR